MKNKYAKAVIGGVITGGLIAAKVMIMCYESGYATGLKAAEGDESAERAARIIVEAGKEVTRKLAKK